MHIAQTTCNQENKGILLLAMHSRTFRWYSSATLVSLCLDLFPNSLIRFGGFCLLCVRRFLSAYSSKEEALNFLETTVREKVETNKKPMQGEIQGTRKPNALVGFLRQKGLCIHPLAI